MNSEKYSTSAIEHVGTFAVQSHLEVLRGVLGTNIFLVRGFYILCTQFQFFARSARSFCGN